MSGRPARARARRYDDAISITLAVLIVSSVAFVQEYRSEQSLAALNSLVPPRATALRGGKRDDIEARELVPGDVILVRGGDRVPADCRVLECVELKVDESSLTGEGEPANKTVECDAAAEADAAGPEAAVAECANAVFMGTLVCHGHAKCVVVGVGMATEFGKAFAEMKGLEQRKTPLQLQMDALGRTLSIASFAVIGGIALAGLARGQRFVDVFQIGVSLAVAAIPEGLPICVTVTLALGVMRMSERRAIVKKLPAVEALGCASVVCVDKTGTLTQNEMTATELFCVAEADVVRVTGVGYTPRARAVVRRRRG